MPAQPSRAVVVDLTAVVVAVSQAQPRVLVVRGKPPGQALDALPSGPLEEHHRTLEAGLRSWVAQQAQAALGHVEQLYTYGDRDRTTLDGDGRRRALSIGYLALVRQSGTAASGQAVWPDWYRYFPWEDWRQGRPAAIDRLEPPLRRWARSGERKERLAIAFGLDGVAWSDERVLERYELLYEVGLAAEAGVAMQADHRRILATAIARLRGKIKYRPVVFELLPPGFTLLQLQRTVEALAGVLLHKQNFRRLVESQGLVEETGRIITQTGGRPAREVRFREEVLLERPTAGTRLPVARAAD